jgi:hypothetical protein
MANEINRILKIFAGLQQDACHPGQMLLLKKAA